VSERILVVFPTFNERDNLERMVTSVRALGHDVMVVDDNSPDGTGAIADRLAAADGAVDVLHRPAKLGLGSAYVAAFRLGLQRGYDLLIEMDADGSHNAGYLPAIIAAARDGGGLGLGSRYVPGGGVVGAWPRRRRLLSWAANVYCRVLLGLSVHDCTGGFRCYTRPLLERIGLDSIISEGYSFQVEMVFRTTRAGFAVREVPIVFEDRLAGVSKVSRGEIFTDLVSVARLRLRNGR
jgi:dolichol-phosphate mannosyltransferase